MPKNREKGMRTVSKLFMYGTSLEGIEQLMVMVPNFQPRRSGIVINNYFNCQGGDGDCKLSVINVDDSCRNCNDCNFKINVDKKRYKTTQNGRMLGYMQMMVNQQLILKIEKILMP